MSVLSGIHPIAEALRAGSPIDRILIEGGRAPNVIPDYARAMLLIRLIGPTDDLRRQIIEAVEDLVTVEFTLEIPFVRLRTLDGIPTMVAAFTTDIPAFGDIHLPVWRTFSPRLAVVYDLSGKGKTAILFGFNRFNDAATTVIASLYDPANAANILSTVAWTPATNDPNPRCRLPGALAYCQDHF